MKVEKKLAMLTLISSDLLMTPLLLLVNVFIIILSLGSMTPKSVDHLKIFGLGLPVAVHKMDTDSPSSTSRLVSLKDTLGTAV